MSQNPYRSPMEPFPPKPELYGPPPLRHSGLGIASFVLAMISGMGVVVMIGVATYFAATLGDQFNEQSTAAILVGLGIFAGIGAAAIGAALGLAGLVQPQRNKVFAVLGLVINVMVIFGVCGIMGLGLALG